MNKLILLTVSTIIFVNLIGCGDADNNKVSQIETNKSSIGIKNIPKSDEKPFIKKYAIKSGEIEYEIKGSSNIMGMSTQTTGNKRLIFSNYGSDELVEESRTDKQNINNQEHINKKHTIVYTKGAVIYHVDFKTKKITRMNNPSISIFLGMLGGDISQNIEKNMKSFGGKKIGKDKVLGYECDVWSIMGTKQCIYKGIPLKVESNIMGMINIEVATKVDFDKDIDKDDFKLPNFPIVTKMGQEIDKSNLEAMDKKAQEEALKNLNSIKEVGQVIQKVQEEIQKNSQMSEDEKAEVLMKSVLSSKNMDSRFAKQKDAMPKMLDMMKSYRKCIANSNSQTDMDRCINNVEKITKELGLDEFDDEPYEKPVWSKANKEKTLKEIDDGIKELEKTLPCMKKANNMMEFIQCARDVH